VFHRRSNRPGLAGRDRHCPLALHAGPNAEALSDGDRADKLRLADDASRRVLQPDEPWTPAHGLVLPVRVAEQEAQAEDEALRRLPNNDACLTLEHTRHRP
jgi:hypothetical protein